MPPVPVCRVATTCFVVCPAGSCTSVTVSPAFLFETVPLSVTGVPYLTAAGDAASVTCGGGPLTTTAPLSLAWSPSW